MPAQRVSYEMTRRIGLLSHGVHRVPAIIGWMRSGGMFEAMVPHKAMAGQRQVLHLRPEERTWIGRSAASRWLDDRIAYTRSHGARTGEQPLLVLVDICPMGDIDGVSVAGRYAKGTITPQLYDLVPR